MPFTIVTDRQPDAVPIGASVIAPANPDWALLIEVPNYNVRAAGFNPSATRINQDGVVEITSPLLVANAASSTVWISARITRAGGLIVNLAYRVPVGANDVLTIPINGQFLTTNEKIEVQAQTAAALGCTVSYTRGLAEVEV